MKARLLLAAGALLLVAPYFASAQVIINPPYYNTQPILYTPQISTVTSGTVSDVQATVSHDRKYVTLTMQPQLSNVVSFQTFSFTNGTATPGVVGTNGAGAGGGAVNGGAPVNGGGGAGNGGGIAIPASRVPVVRPAASVLDQSGMTMVAPLQ